jgi:chromosome partitioning protein
MLVTPFAREVKRLRSERGLSIRDLAAVLGKSVAYLAKIEVQGEIPGPQFTCEMARSLGATPITLLRLAKESRLSNLEREVNREYAEAFLQADAAQAKPSEQNEEKGAHNMSTVVSLINMKGGVGKTTLAMQLAHSASSMNLRTLVIDLDPQSNLSQALMGPKKYVDHLKASKPTVVQIFDGYIPTSSSNGSPQLLDVTNVIVKKVGYWTNSTLDLIPSRLELSRTLKNPQGKERRLAKALAQIQNAYDLVIIDCAPTESILTEAAYFASRYVIVPIKPEFLATIGLPLLSRSLQEFCLENDDHKIEIAGLVFVHSSSYSSGPEGQQSIKDVTKVASENAWHICANQVRYSASYAKSAREQTPLSRTSYARDEVVRGFRRLASEVFELVGVAPVKP